MHATLFLARGIGRSYHSEIHRIKLLDLKHWISISKTESRLRRELNAQQSTRESVVGYKYMAHISNTLSSAITSSLCAPPLVITTTKFIAVLASCRWSRWEANASVQVHARRCIGEVDCYQAVYDMYSKLGLVTGRRVR